MAQRAPDTRFYTLMQAFRNPNPNALMTNTTVWEVIEDSANAFEIRAPLCVQHLRKRNSLDDHAQLSGLRVMRRAPLR